MSESGLKADLVVLDDYNKNIASVADDVGYTKPVNVDVFVSQEDRGWHVWVWFDETRGVARFEPFEGANHLICYSVPIGWSLAVSRVHGVVLRSVYGKTISATDLVTVSAICTDKRIVSDVRL